MSYVVGVAKCMECIHSGLGVADCGVHTLRHMGDT